MDGNAFARRSKKRMSEVSKSSLKRPSNHLSSPSHQSNFSSSRGGGGQDETKSTTSSLDSLDYKHETGISQFLRLRREAWKIRLGSLKINKRLLSTAFKAWAGYKDPDPKLTKEEIERERAFLKEEQERKRKLLQVPKNYFGANSLDSDYIIGELPNLSIHPWTPAAARSHTPTAHTPLRHAKEPGVNDWKTALYTAASPVPNTNILDPVDPLPNQLPKSLNQMYKSAIDSGHATFLRQLLKYRNEHPKKLHPIITSYAMQSGYPTVVKVMLDFGIDPNGTAVLPYTKSRNKKNRCTEKQTYLHRASHRLDGPTMELLIQAGADVR